MINGKLFVISETLAVLLCGAVGVLFFLGSLFLGLAFNLNPYQTGVLAIGTSAPVGLSVELQGWIRRKIFRVLLARKVICDYLTLYHHKGVKKTMKYLNGLMATAVFVAFGTWLLALSILIISYELVIRVVAWMK